MQPNSNRFVCLLNDGKFLAVENTE